MVEQAVDAASEQLDSLVNDIFWPLREYADVRDFVSRFPSASLALWITGFILESAGISPGVSAAVGALGLAITVVEVMLRVLLNSEDPVSKLGLKQRSMGILLYLVSGFAVFVVLEPGRLTNLQVSGLQFVAGIIITYLAGAVFMRVYTHLDNSGAKVSTRILVSILSTIGVILGLIILVPAVLTGFGKGEMVTFMEEKPAQINRSIL